MKDSAADSHQQPIKFLITADAAGGVWQYSVDLIKGLVQRGAEVLLATMGPRPSQEQKRQLLALPKVTLAESDYALEWMPDAERDMDAAGEWLFNLASNFQPDIVHLNGYAAGNLPWRKPIVITAHSCVYSWWRAVHGCAPGAEWAAYRRRVLEGLAGCTQVIAPSAFMADALQFEYGVEAGKISVIHNFSRSSQAAVQEKETFFLAAGRIWDVAKNLSLLARIVPQLDAEVRIAGSGQEPQTSADGESIRYLGTLSHSELIDQMNRASIFVHPALYEPFGLAVLEAARASCCLVLSDIPSLRELWGEAAVFIDPRDPERWIFELNRLLADSARRQSFGVLAHARARNYRAAEMMERYWNLYRSVAAGRMDRGVAA